MNFLRFGVPLRTCCGGGDAGLDLFLRSRDSRRARFLARAFWGGVEWADPLGVFNNFQLLCGQPEGTSAFSAVGLVIERASLASDTP